MDLSALIFVALAVAWATYLIPKALRHHEDSATSRSVEGFSTRIRVLARREPVDSRSTRLVVGAGQPASTATPVEPTSEREPESKPVPVAVRRAAARRAAKRRLRVVLTILLAGIGVGVAAALGHLSFAWLAAPGGVLVLWLFACRRMVRRERAAVVPSRRLPVVTEEPAPADADEAGGPVTEEIVAVDITVEAEMASQAASEATPDPEPETTQPASQQAGGGWDPVPVTLPTYVAKEPATRRSVRTIDLDSTGVWTSGPLAADSALAREADAERARTPRAEDEKKRRASGS